MAEHKDSWFYNSQTFPDATNALKVLASKGLAEIYWIQTPEFGEFGENHINRITDRGLQFGIVGGSGR